MFRTICQLGLIAACCAGLALGQQRTLTGYLIDKACAADTIKKGEGAAKGHDVGCALMDECAQSGFGVITADNKFIAFDAAGNKQAVAALKASTKKTDLRVTVTGDVSGNSVKVASLKLQ
jgi:hypothetical protein